MSPNFPGRSDWSDLAGCMHRMATFNFHRRCLRTMAGKLVQGRCELVTGVRSQSSPVSLPTGRQQEFARTPNRVLINGSVVFLSHLSVATQFSYIINELSREHANDAAGRAFRVFFFFMVSTSPGYDEAAFMSSKLSHLGKLLVFPSVAYHGQEPALSDQLSSIQSIIFTRVNCAVIVMTLMIYCRRKR